MKWIILKSISALCPKSTIIHIDQCGNEKALKPAISNTINTKWVTVEMQWTSQWLPAIMLQWL